MGVLNHNYQKDRFAGAADMCMRAGLDAVRRTPSLSGSAATLAAAGVKSAVDAGLLTSFIDLALGMLKSGDREVLPLT